MRYFICLVFLIPTLVTAQSKGARTCRILYAGAAADAPEKLHLFDGTSSQEVEMSRMNLSPVYKLPVGPLVVTLLPSPVSKPQEVSPDAPKATIEEIVTDLYLIVTPDPSNKITPVKIQVVDVDSKKAAKGQMIWLNLTANTVNGKVGIQELVLEPNSKAVLGLPTKKAGDYPVNLTFRIPGNEVVYPLCETQWSHDGLANSLFFVVMESGNRTPRVVGFPDHREPEPTKSKKPGKK